MFRILAYKFNDLYNVQQIFFYWGRGGEIKIIQLVHTFVCYTNLGPEEILVSGNFSWRQVKLSQIEAATDVITDVGVEEKGHALGPKISIPIFTGPHRVNLGVSIQITYPLDIHHNEVMS